MWCPPLSLPLFLFPNLTLFFIHLFPFSLSLSIWPSLPFLEGPLVMSPVWLSQVATKNAASKGTHSNYECIMHYAFYAKVAISFFTRTSFGRSGSTREKKMQSPMLWSNICFVSCLVVLLFGAFSIFVWDAKCCYFRWGFFNQWLFMTRFFLLLFVNCFSSCLRECWDLSATIITRLYDSVWLGNIETNFVWRKLSPANGENEWHSAIRQDHSITWPLTIAECGA